ncbi:hypothetical protein, partial [Bacillus thuringiensis]|uniref:hypothetical protein n=1 Tax=Bacillus thuringiensis TaxID=1428 RepID=UPI0026E3D38A
SKKHSKISTFFTTFHPCGTFFGWFLAFAKPNRPKTGLSCSTWISNCTSRTANSSVQSMILFPYRLTLCGVSPPHGEPALTPKNKVRNFFC